MRVLAAEDEAVPRAILKAALETLGHECLAAENGEEAWRIFSRTPGVDVVVGDLKRLGEEVGAEEVRAVARELEGFAED